MCILCTLLLRGWGAGKGGGTDNALWNRLQLWLHGKRWRWLLWVDVFRQGKEENPGWRWVVWKGPRQTKDISFSVWINIISCFLQEIHFCSSMDLPSKWKQCSSCSGNFPLAPPSYVWNIFFCFVCSSCSSLFFFFLSVCWMSLLLLLSLLFRMHFLLKFLAS